MTAPTTDTNRLAEIKARLDAIEVRDIEDTDAAFDAESRRLKTAKLALCAHTPSDLEYLLAENARLQERLDTAEGRLARHAALHKPVRRYIPDDGETSYDTYFEAADATPYQHGAVTFFEICEHCASIEIAEGCEHDYRESLWPCKDAEALGIAEVSR